MREILILNWRNVVVTFSTTFKSFSTWLFSEWIFNCPQEFFNTLLLFRENFEDVFKKLLPINVKSNLGMLDTYSYFKKLQNKTQIGFWQRCKNKPTWSHYSIGFFHQPNWRGQLGIIFFLNKLHFSLRFEE